MNTLTLNRGCGPMPFCTMCQRSVESVEYETPVETVFSWDAGVTAFHTGEIIITVTCHGETWKMSNWRGRL